MILPSIYAILIYILQSFFTYELSFLYSSYGLFISLWSQFFIRNWDRKSSELEVEWDNYTSEYEKENTRDEFQGEIIKSVITDKEEKYFSKQRRILLFIKSGIKAIPYLCLAFFIIVIYLNLTGVILPEDNSIIEINFLTELAKKGYFLKLY